MKSYNEVRAKISGGETYNKIWLNLSERLNLQQNLAQPFSKVDVEQKSPIKHFLKVDFGLIY
jgi:hypothetical protein